MSDGNDFVDIGTLVDRLKQEDPERYARAKARVDEYVRKIKSGEIEVKVVDLTPGVPAWGEMNEVQQAFAEVRWQLANNNGEGNDQ